MISQAEYDELLDDIAKLTEELKQLELKVNKINKK
jgi:flagellar motility protein MotE (MotC chaperone)